MHWVTNTVYHGELIHFQFSISCRFPRVIYTWQWSKDDDNSKYLVTSLNSRELCYYLLSLEYVFSQVNKCKLCRICKSVLYLWIYFEYILIVMALTQKNLLHETVIVPYINPDNLINTEVKYTLTTYIYTQTYYSSWCIQDS